MVARCVWRGEDVLLGLAIIDVRLLDRVDADVRHGDTFARSTLTQRLLLV